MKESPTANKSFEDPNTDEKVNYEDLMGRCIVDMDTGLRLLPFEKPTIPKEGRSQAQLTKIHLTPMMSGFEVLKDAT